MRAFIGIVWAVLLCLGLSGTVQAQATRMAQANSRQALPDTDPDVATIYRGLLGEQRVQMVLMADEEQPGAYEGDYFIFGGGRNIQVAGEIDAERFYLEETDDGEHVSGSWDGKLVIEANRAYIVGTWRKDDESQALPFKLERVLRARAYLKRST